MAIHAMNWIESFADETYQRLREFLSQQVAGSLERVLIPSRLAGSTRFLSGLAWIPTRLFLANRTRR